MVAQRAQARVGVPPDDSRQAGEQCGPVDEDPPVAGEQVRR